VEGCYARRRRRNAQARQVQRRTLREVKCCRRGMRVRTSEAYTKPAGCRSPKRSSSTPAAARATAMFPLRHRRCGMPFARAATPFAAAAAHRSGEQELVRMAGPSRHGAGIRWYAAALRLPRGRQDAGRCCERMAPAAGQEERHTSEYVIPANTRIPPPSRSGHTHLPHHSSVQRRTTRRRTHRYRLPARLAQLLNE